MVFCHCTLWFQSTFQRLLNTFELEECQQLSPPKGACFGSCFIGLSLYASYLATIAVSNKVQANGNLPVLILYHSDSSEKPKFLFIVVV